MKILIFAFLTFALLFASFQTAYACTCLANVPIAKAFEKADTVFSGKVVQIKTPKPVRSKNSDAVRVGNNFGSVEAVFEVRRVWKGVEKKQVSVFTASNSAACGYNFVKAQTYLVYGNSGGGEKIYTNICTRTSKLENAAEDFKEIGEGKDIKEIISANHFPGKEKSPREVSFLSKDGVKLFADIYASPKGKSAPLIMLFHQGGGDARGEYSPIIPKLLKLGYNVFATDTRQGGDRFGTNRTMSGVKKEFTYCDAYQDLESALEYTKKQGFTGKKVIWGSSFSATLVLNLGANYAEDLAGVLAFSPASGPPMGDCQPVVYAENLKIPTLILRPRREMQSERSQNQFVEFKRQGHQTYIAENGVHGSSMLVESRIEGSAKEHWKIVLKFIEKTLE